MRAKIRLEGHQALGSLDVMELKKSPKKWLQNTATKLSFGNLEHFLFILGTVPFNFASIFRRYLWMYHVPVQFYEQGIKFVSLKRTQTGCVSFCYFFFFLNSFDGYQSLIKSIGLAIINLQLYNWSCWPLEKLSFSLPYLWQAAKHINLSPPSSVDGQTSSPITLTVNSSGEAKIASLQCDIFFPVLFGKIMIKC